MQIQSRHVEDEKSRQEEGTISQILSKRKGQQGLRIGKEPQSLKTRHKQSLRTTEAQQTEQQIPNSRMRLFKQKTKINQQQKNPKPKPEVAARLKKV